MAETAEARNIAVYIDLENVAIGVRDARFKTLRHRARAQAPARQGQHRSAQGLRRLGRYADYKRRCTRPESSSSTCPAASSPARTAPTSRWSWMLSSSPTPSRTLIVFALVTGDSDFSPLVLKLRENNKHTIGIGVKNSTSPLLIDSCDEFIFYDDLVRRPRGGAKKKGRMTGLPARRPARRSRCCSTRAEALQREDKQLLQLAGQGDHEAQAAAVQRGVPRLPLVQPPARRRARRTTS